MILLVTQHRAFSRLRMEREHAVSVLKLHELWRAILKGKNVINGAGEFHATA